jgi:hypothetical protein
MSNETVVPPGGQFSMPETTTTPLLAFRCSPAIRPYLAEDASSSAAFIIDVTVTYTQVEGAIPITLPTAVSKDDLLVVTVSLNGKTLAQGSVPLNSSKYELPFSLVGLQTQKEAYNISCTASYSSTNGQQSSAAPSLFDLYKIPILPSWTELFSDVNLLPITHTHATRGMNAQTFETTAALFYLPDPSQGSVTKMDLRTGALLVKPANGSGGDYEPVFPIGFYTTYGGYLASNASVLDELKAQG